jgi:RNA-binding protein PNO1
MEAGRPASAAGQGESSSSSGAMAVDAAGGVEKPRFEALMPSEMSGGRPQFRKVPVPQHRFAPLKKAWMDIYTPVYEHMKIDIRMNLKVASNFSPGCTLLIPLIVANCLMDISKSFV